MRPIEKPLTPLQVELLKMFSTEISEEEVLDIKRLLAKYFADKASDEMDELWKKRGWTNDTMEDWLKGDQ